MNRRTGWLWLRMTAATLPLVALNALLVHATVWIVTEPLAALWTIVTELRLSGLDPIGASPPAWQVVGLALALVWPQYVYSKRRMRTAGCSSRASVELEDRVTRLAQQIDVPVPTVNVAEYERPNSMVFGSSRSPTLVLTKGLLETADDETLDAVIAHELAHVKHGDVRLMTLLNVLPILAEGPAPSSGGTSSDPSLLDALLVPLAVLGDSPATPASSIVGGGGGAASGSGAALKVFRAVSLGVFRLFSQYREYVADATAAELLDSPERVAAALAELDEEYGLPDEDARARDNTVRQACFLPHGFGDTCEDAGIAYDASMDWSAARDADSAAGERQWDNPSWTMDGDRIDDADSTDEEDSESLWDRLVPGTHPSTADRIERLQACRE